MNSILLNRDVLVYLISETLIWGALLISAFIALIIIFKWDFNSTLKRQYDLEKRAYLVVTTIFIAFSIKFLLLPFFVFTIDELNTLIPGAMCAAGVISANSYGLKLLFLKIVILFLLLLWLFINYYDLEAKNYPYFKFKNWLFLIIFSLITIELYLDFLYFSNIDINRPVSCCSALFGQLEGANPLPFGLNTPMLLILFYLLYLLIGFATFLKQTILEVIAYTLFIFSAYYGVVYFFGTYIYELPTHKCPFCMLQRDYYYIGYLIWGSLFIGVFLGLISAILKLFFKIENRKIELYAFYLTTLFITICSLYVISYYLKNGVFL